MAYDRADWHYGGDFPADLPPENGGTHIGMFVAWAISHGLEGDLRREDSAASVEAVRERRMTGREFLFGACDEKFWEEDLSDEGNAFAGWYYASEGPYMQARRLRTRTRGRCDPDGALLQIRSLTPDGDYLAPCSLSAQPD